MGMEMDILVFIWHHDLHPHQLSSSHPPIGQARIGFFIASQNRSPSLSPPPSSSVAENQFLKFAISFPFKTHFHESFWWRTTHMGRPIDRRVTVSETLTELSLNVIEGIENSEPDLFNDFSKFICQLCDVPSPVSPYYKSIYLEAVQHKNISVLY